MASEPPSIEAERAVERLAAVVAWSSTTATPSASYQLSSASITARPKPWPRQSASVHTHWM